MGEDEVEVVEEDLAAMKDLRQKSSVCISLCLVRSMHRTYYIVNHSTLFFLQLMLMLACILFRGWFSHARRRIRACMQVDHHREGSILQRWSLPREQTQNRKGRRDLGKSHGSLFYSQNGPGCVEQKLSTK